MDENSLDEFRLIEILKLVNSGDKDSALSLFAKHYSLEKEIKLAIDKNKLFYLNDLIEIFGEEFFRKSVEKHHLIPYYFKTALRVSFEEGTIGGFLANFVSDHDNLYRCYLDGRPDSLITLDAIKACVNHSSLSFSDLSHSDIILLLNKTQSTISHKESIRFPEVFKLLVEKGMNPLIEDKQGNPYIFYLSFLGEKPLDWLDGVKEYGVEDFNYTCSKGRHVGFYILDLLPNIDFDQSMSTVSRYFIGMFENGLDIYQKDSEGKTIIDHLGEGSFFFNEDVKEELSNVFQAECDRLEMISRSVQVEAPESGVQFF